MTNTSHDNLGLFSDVPWMVVYISEAVLILTENFITVYIFCNIRKRLKRTSYLLINLSAADVLVGIALIFWLWDGIAAMVGRYVGNTARKTAIFIDILGLVSSISSLALISLERMFAILWPFHHRSLIIWHYHVSVGIVWLIASINATITVQFGVFDTKGNSEYRYVVAVVIIMSVVVITGAYLAIWISTRLNRLPSTACRSMVERDRKLAKTLFVVTILSVITSLPAGISLMFTADLPPSDMYSFINQTVMVAQYANSFLNPVVYSFKMPEFKMSLKKLLCRCQKKTLSFSDNAYGSSTGVILRSLKAIETN